MNLNYSLLEKAKKSSSQILAVTKYWNAEETEIMTAELKKHYPELIRAF